MKISRIKIENILGIEQLEFEPGQFSTISGGNGEGKTSILSAIQAAVGGGHDATLLRKGADKGEVVLVLDDGTEIRKQVTERASPLRVTQDGKAVNRPSEFLKTLTDLLSVNPIDFLLAPKKDRARVLLETMPLVIDAERLGAIVGHQVQGQGIELVDHVRREIYDSRTGTNRAIKEKEATINQLLSVLPDATEGVTGSEQDLTEQLSEFEQAKSAELARIQGKLDGIRASTQADIAAVKEALQTKIDALRAEAQAEIDAKKQALSTIEGKATAQVEKTLNQFAADAGPINEQLAIIRSNRNASAKREQALATVADMKTGLQALQADEQAQTAALAEIDNYKQELLASMPIPGLVVRDGDLFFNDVQFDRVNTAEQVRIAVEVAKLRAGDLGIICVDRIECLSSEAFEDFKRMALASDLQMIVTRVTDEPGLHIKQDNAQ